MYYENENENVGSIYTGEYFKYKFKIQIQSLVHPISLYFISS